MKNMKKILVLALAALLLVAVSVAGTVAYLTATTTPVTNTFNPSNIEVDVVESTGSDYQLIPGVEIVKDPKVTVTTDVEAWVFLTVEKAGNWPAGNLVSWEIDTTWIELKSADDNNGVAVYFNKVDNDDEIPVLKGNKVTVSDDLTQEEMSAMYDENGTPVPGTLKFNAYAIQFAGFDFAEGAQFTVVTEKALAAWNEINK